MECCLESSEQSRGSLKVELCQKTRERDRGVSSESPSSQCVIYKFPESQELPCRQVVIILLFFYSIPSARCLYLGGLYVIKIRTDLAKQDKDWTNLIEETKLGPIQQKKTTFSSEDCDELRKARTDFTKQSNRQFKNHLNYKLTKPVRIEGLVCLSPRL